MIYHAASGLLFLECPRTGSTAVSRALIKHCGFARIAPPHSGPAGMPAGAVPFSTIRHPGDLAVSWYFNSAPTIPFGVEWLETIHVENQHVERGRFFWRYAPVSARLLRWEWLEHDLELLLAQRLDEESYDFYDGLVDRVNETPGKRGRDWRDFYDDASREWMRRVWGEEMERFGYAM